MSSASPDKPQKQKVKKSPFSIVAIRRKKKKDKPKTSRSSVHSEDLESPASEIHLTRPAQVHEKSRMEAQVEDLVKQLEEERQRADDLEQMLVESDTDMIKWREEEKEKTDALEQKLQEREAEAMKWREKVANLEEMGKDLDDDSFAAAQEFQLKQQLDDMTAEVEKYKAMGDELQKTKEELHDALLQVEELQFHQQRDTTRSKIQNIREDRSSSDEVLRLQKELRQMELKFQKETSLLQAQVKSSEGSLQRAQEKTLAIRRKLDELDKDKMELKLENKRLQRKFEKQETYSERKRMEMEKETQGLEIQNLRRQKKKLERRLSTSLSNLVSPENSRPASSLSDVQERDLSDIDGSDFTSGTTLAEMRLQDVERQLNKLQAQTYKLEKENNALKEELLLTKQNEEVLASQVERFQNELLGEKRLLAELEGEAVQLRAQSSAGGSDQYIKDLQEKYQHLEKKLQDREMEFRVKEKDMRATNEEMKRQMEELEMAKLRAELGEPEEGEEGEEEEELTDTEDQEVTEIRERLNSLTTELDLVKTNNDALKDSLEKQKKENEELMQAIDEEIEVGESRDDAMTQKNEELSQKLKDHSERYAEAMDEISRLKQTVEQQVG